MMMDINSSYSYALHSKDGNKLQLLADSLNENLDDLVEFFDRVFDGVDVDWDTVTTDELVEALEYCKNNELTGESRLFVDCEYLIMVYEDLLIDGEEEFSPEGLLNFIKNNKHTSIDLLNTVLYKNVYNWVKYDGLLGREYEGVK